MKLGQQFHLQINEKYRLSMSHFKIRIQGGGGVVTNTRGVVTNTRTCGAGEAFLVPESGHEVFLVVIVHFFLAYCTDGGTS